MRQWCGRWKGSIWCLAQDLNVHKLLDCLCQLDQPVIKRISIRQCLNLCHAEFFWENIKTYSHFPSFLNIDMSQAVEILPQNRKQYLYYTVSIIVADGLVTQEVQDISSPIIDLECLVYFRLSTRRIKTNFRRVKSLLLFHSGASYHINQCRDYDIDEKLHAHKYCPKF